MRADMHVHSVYSDGALTPEALARTAKANGAELVSLTDHDNLAGDKEKRAAFEKEGVRYLTGVEMSAYEGKVKVHMTGYAYDAFSPLCAKYQQDLLNRSEKRLADVLFRLKKYKNITLSAAAVRAELQVPAIPVHTMHIARALVKAGFFPDVKQTFRACFTPELPTYSFVGRPTPDEAIEMIHALGGFVCVAHPGRIALPFDERERLIRNLFRRGADGIECFYPAHTEEETVYFKNLADESNLLKTGGSDFHFADGKRTIGLPVFFPDEDLLSAIHAREKR